MSAPRNWAGIAIILLGMDLVLIVALLSLVIMPSPSPFVKYTPLPPDLTFAPMTVIPASPEPITPSPTPEPDPTRPPGPVTPSPTPEPDPTPAPGLPTPSPAPASDRKWIEVSLRKQKLTAYEDGKPVFETLISSGVARYPTVTGRFRIYLKLLYTDMAGPGYYLRNVPYVMYFYRGYALHGAYWHNNFGRPMSHGCVNMRVEDARWLFNWTDPPLPPGANFVYSSPDNPGTLVIIYH